MLHNEHLRKADELYEIRHDNNGNAIHVFIKDGEAVIYPSLNSLIEHQFYGEDSERFYMPEEELDGMYQKEIYGYYDFKKLYFNN